MHRPSALAVRPGEPGQPRTGPWSANELAKAQAMRDRGLSSARIGYWLRRSRNSVIGALWRASQNKRRRRRAA